VCTRADVRGCEFRVLPFGDFLLPDFFMFPLSLPFQAFPLLMVLVFGVVGVVGVVGAAKGCSAVDFESGTGKGESTS
jgi:hypothetical protein